MRTQILVADNYLTTVPHAQSCQKPHPDSPGDDGHFDVPSPAKEHNFEETVSLNDDCVAPKIRRRLAYVLRNNGNPLADQFILEKMLVCAVPRLIKQTQEFDWQCRDLGSYQVFEDRTLSCHNDRCEQFAVTGCETVVVQEKQATLIRTIPGATSRDGSALFGGKITANCRCEFNCSPKELAGKCAPTQTELFPIGFSSAKSKEEAVRLALITAADAITSCPAACPIKPGPSSIVCDEIEVHYNNNYGVYSAYVESCTGLCREIASPSPTATLAPPPPPPTNPTPTTTPTPIGTKTPTPSVSASPVVTGSATTTTSSWWQRLYSR